MALLTAEYHGPPMIVPGRVTLERHLGALLRTHGRVFPASPVTEIEVRERRATYI